VDRQGTAPDPDVRVSLQATRFRPGRRGAVAPSPEKPLHKRSCEIPLEKLDFGGVGE